jgi:hypothetical protein
MLNLTPAIQQAVQQAIAADDIPADKRGAFILVTDATGVHAVLAARVDEHWTIRAGFQHDWTGGNGVSAEVKAVW